MVGQPGNQNTSWRTKGNLLTRSGEQGETFLLSRSFKNQNRKTNFVVLDLL